MLVIMLGRWAERGLPLFYELIVFPHAPELSQPTRLWRRMCHSFSNCSTTTSSCQNEFVDLVDI